ncbi:MAG: hypothetical protein AAF721_23740 [Myxococcota bacterium]
MPALHVVAVEHKRVPVHVAINGVPLSSTAPPTAKGFWRLEPFVVDGPNTISIRVEAPKPGATLTAVVQRGTAGSWSTVVKKEVVPAAGTMTLPFEATDAAVPAPKAARLGSLSSADRDAIGTLLQRVRTRVSDDPGGELIDLFTHRLDYTASIGDTARAELEAQLLDTFADLADPDLTPPPSAPAELKLVCSGTLCVPLGADGQHWLQAKSDGRGIALAIALGRVDGAWAVVG